MNLKNLWSITGSERVKPLYMIPDYFKIKPVLLPGETHNSFGDQFYFSRTWKSNSKGEARAEYSFFRMRTKGRLRPDIDDKHGTVNDFQAKTQLWELANEY